MGRLQSLQDICILDVSVDFAGTGVRLDLFGGPSRICGSLAMSLAADNAADHVGLLRRWQRDQTRLTLVSHESHVTLTDDAALVAAATRP